MFTVDKIKTRIANLFKSSEKLRKERIKREITEIMEKIGDIREASNRRSDDTMSALEVPVPLAPIVRPNPQLQLKESTLAFPSPVQDGIFEKYARFTSTLKERYEREYCMWCDGDVNDYDCTCYHEKYMYTSEQIYDAAITVKKFLRRLDRSRNRKAKLAQVLDENTIPCVLIGLIQEYM